MGGEDISKNLYIFGYLAPVSLEQPKCQKCPQQNYSKNLYILPDKKNSSKIARIIENHKLFAKAFDLLVFIFKTEIVIFCKFYSKRRVYYLKFVIGKVINILILFISPPFLQKDLCMQESYLRSITNKHEYTSALGKVLTTVRQRKRR